MAIPRRLLKKTAGKFARRAPREKPVKATSSKIPEHFAKIPDIGQALEEMEGYHKESGGEIDRIEHMREQYEKGMTKGHIEEKDMGRAAPTVIDFSKLAASKPAAVVAPPRAPIPEKIQVVPVNVDMEKMAKQIDTIAERDVEKMRNIPLKAHKIPKQYIKTMRSEWKPPVFDQIDLSYNLIEPFAMANLKWNTKSGKLNYFLLEPALTEEQKRKFGLIKEIVIDLLDVGLFEVGDAAGIKQVLKDRINRVISDYGIRMTEHEYSKLLYYMYRDFLGLETIEPLMHDPALEDISCDGVKIPLYVYHRKYGSIPTNMQFKSEDDLNRFVIKIAQKCGKHISVAEPLLDGALPDGSRVQATFSSHKDISMHGSTFTVRKFTRDPLTVVDLLNFGTLPEMIAAYLWIALEYKKSILVAGGTATGKTSLLNALSMFFPAEDKVVSIEDTPEIRLPHEHWLQKVIRTGFGREDVAGRKMGEISMYDLLRAALRERPDILIVGEVRGKEAYVLFQGMATGHCGLATIHGDSVDAIMHRLQTKPINLPTGLLQHLNIIIVLTKVRIKGIEVRRIKEVVEVLGLSKEHEPIINTLFRWDPSTDTFEFASDKSYVLQKIIEDKGVEEKSIWEEMQRRTQILKWMKDQNIRDYRDVGRIIQRYYKKPEEVLENI